MWSRFVTVIEKLILLLIINFFLRPKSFNDIFNLECNKTEIQYIIYHNYNITVQLPSLQFFSAKLWLDKIFKKLKLCRKRLNIFQ